MEENMLKESLEKLLTVSSQIVDLYCELKDKLKNGESFEDCSSIVSQIKIKILVEENILNSFSREKVLKLCNFVFDMIEKTLYNKSSTKELILKTRIESLLNQKKDISCGRGIVLSGKSNSNLVFGRVDLFFCFFYIKAILKFKDDLMNNNFDFSISNDMKLSLMREMYLDMFMMFARFRSMELIFFLFNSEPSLDALLDDNLKEIESVILEFDAKKENIILNKTAQLAIDLLSILEIDDLNEDNIEEFDSKTVYNYLFDMNRLDVVLSYCNKDVLKKVEDYLNETYSLSEIKKALGDEVSGLTDVELEDYLDIRKVQFRSESVECATRELVKSYKGKIR